MTSEDYAAEVQLIVDRVKKRITIQGEESYSLGATQKFETKSTSQIVQDALEEIEDLIAYSCQLHIRLSSWMSMIDRYGPK